MSKALINQLEVDVKEKEESNTKLQRILDEQ